MLSFRKVTDCRWLSSRSRQRPHAITHGAGRICFSDRPLLGLSGRGFYLLPYPNADRLPHPLPRHRHNLRHRPDLRQSGRGRGHERRGTGEVPRPFRVYVAIGVYRRRGRGMNQNTIDSLRRLAERPGTEHEGIVAREMLKRPEAKRSEGFRDYELEYLALFRRHMRGEITLHEFLRSSRSQTAEPWTCPCGDTIYMNGKCLNQLRHLEVQTEIRSRFKRGDRAYYNYWAYPENCPCEVQAFVKLQRD